MLRTKTILAHDITLLTSPLVTHTHSTCNCDTRALCTLKVCNSIVVVFVGVTVTTHYNMFIGLHLDAVNSRLFRRYLRLESSRSDSHAYVVTRGKKNPFFRFTIPANLVIRSFAFREGAQQEANERQISGGCDWFWNLNSFILACICARLFSTF